MRARRTIRPWSICSRRCDVELGFSRFDFAGEVDAEGAWVLNPNRSVEILRGTAGVVEPVLILGTAFSYVYLLDFLSEQNLRLRLSGSCAVETGGYKGRTRTLQKAELHSLITHHLGIPAMASLVSYGMSELSSQAYDHVVEAGEARRFQFPPWARVQIISPETGLEASGSGRVNSGF